MKKNRIVLSVLFIFTLLQSSSSFAHTSDSFFTQIMHTVSHAHHGYAGLLVVLLLIAGFKLRNSLKVKEVRSQKKR